MAEVSEIEAGGEIRTVKDATARQGVAANTAAIEEIIAKIPASASTSNQMATATDVKESIPTSQNGAPSQRVTWSRWGKVVVLKLKGTFTDGEEIDIPFAPHTDNSFLLVWATTIVGWADILPTKKALIHITSGSQAFGSITYITKDDVY